MPEGSAIVGEADMYDSGSGNAPGWRRRDTLRLAGVVLAGVVVSALLVALLADSSSGRNRLLSTGGDLPPNTAVSLVPRAAEPPLVGSNPTTAPALTGPSPSTAAGVPPTTSPPQATVAAALATCSETEQGVLATPTATDFSDNLIGTWVLCQTPSFFGTGEGGLQISRGGTWSKLSVSATGQLMTMAGWGNEGTWSVLDDSSMNRKPGTFQVNFFINGEGSTASFPTAFSSGPPKMRLDNMGIYIADYVPTSQPVLPALPTPTATGPLATCSVSEQGVLATPTEDAFINDFVGIWLLCKTPSVFGTDEVGLQISRDGTWSKLTRNPAGQLIAVAGWGNEGTWTVLDSSMTGAPGHYQVNLNIDGEGTEITLPIFSSGPPKMRLTDDANPADYVPTSEPVVAAS
jgi:hypothetical protein